MKQRHHQTQWGAQFAVASELCRRGYQVALTLGNHPTVDLMVISPCGTPFVVDVKGQYSENPWPVSPKEIGNMPLFYIFAFVPDPAKGQTRFTVLSQDRVNEHLEANTKAWRARKAERSNKKDPMPCMTPKFIREKAGDWSKLPE